MTVIDDIITTYSEFFTRSIEPVISSPAFQTYGIIFLLLYASTPFFIPIPNEVFILPLYLGGASPLILVLILTIGGFLGDYWMYLLGKHGSNFFRKKKRELASTDHFMHKHGILVFLAPAIPILPSVVGDFVMFVAGHQHIEFKKVAPILIVAETIKATIMMLTVMGIITFLS